MGFRKRRAEKSAGRTGEADPPSADEKVGPEKMSRARRLWDRFTQRASERDIPSIEGKLDRKNKGPVRKIWDTVQAMWRMICDPKAAWGAKALAIGALAYLISPLDAVPDFIPGVGLLDDVGILAAAAGKLGKALKIYMTVAGVTVSAATALKNAAVDTAERAAEIEVRKRLRITAIALGCGIIAAGIVITLKLTLGINARLAVIAFRGTLLCFTLYQAVRLASTLMRFGKIYDRCPKWIAKPLLRWGGRLVKKGLAGNRRLIAFNVALFVWLILMNILAWML